MPAQESWAKRTGKTGPEAAAEQIETRARAVLEEVALELGGGEPDRGAFEDAYCEAYEEATATLTEAERAEVRKALTARGSLFAVHFGEKEAREWFR